MSNSVGGVSVQLPSDPLAKSPHEIIPSTSVPSQTEADLYSKLKKLERELEFIALQEVITYIFQISNFLSLGIHQR